MAVDPPCLTGARRWALAAVAGIVGLFIGPAAAETSRSVAAQVRSAEAPKPPPASAKKPRATKSPSPLTVSHEHEDAGVTSPLPFYSVRQFSGHVRSVGWELAVIGGALVAIGVRDWDWGGSRFQFINEGWFGSNTRHGGMDKIGHAFSAYVIADLLTDRIRANAPNPAGAEITGALLSFGIMGAVETLDGFTGKHRFSREDIVANALGAAFSIFRNSVPGLREKLDFRLMYTPAAYQRRDFAATEGGLLPPYSRQRYIMALKGGGFEALKDTPWRYLELHGGFDARGFSDRERQLGHPVERTFYVGVGLNLNEILFGAGSLPNFARYKDTNPAWVVRKSLEYIQPPYASAYVGTTVRARSSAR
jgi:hypothetical protein